MSDARALIHVLFEYGRPANLRECELDDDGVMGKCKLPWQRGYDLVVKAALQESGVSDATIDIQGQMKKRVVQALPSRNMFDVLSTADLYAALTSLQIKVSDFCFLCLPLRKIKITWDHGY